MICLVELNQRDERQPDRPVTTFNRQAARQRPWPAAQRAVSVFDALAAAVSRAQPAAACIGFCLLVSVRFKTTSLFT